MSIRGILIRWSHWIGVKIQSRCILFFFADGLKVDFDRFFLSASKDMTLKIHAIQKTRGFISSTLSAHREAIVAAYFDPSDSLV